METHQLKLQNLLYEKNHLQRQISSCRNFTTKELNMIEFEESDEIPVSTNPIVHQQKLTQLANELNKRKEMEQRLVELSQHLATMKQETDKKKKFLGSLPKQLDNIEKATKPLQNEMNLKYFNNSETHKKASVLSLPLYTLFMELSSYLDAFPDPCLEISIVDSTSTYNVGGSTKKKIYPRKRDYSSLSVSHHRSNSKSNAVQDIEEGEEVEAADDGHSSKRHKKHQRAPSRSPSVAPTSTTNSAPGSSKMVLTPIRTPSTEPNLQITDEKTNHQKMDKKLSSPVHSDFKGVIDFFEVAQHAVQLSIVHKDFVNLAIRFAFLPHLDVVTVQAMGEGLENLLVNLYPGDTGVDLPNHSLQYALATKNEQDKKEEELAYPPSKAARPFQWAQYLCGFSHLSPQHPIAPSLRSVMRQLINRVESFALLKKQLEQLKRLEIAMCNRVTASKSVLRLTKIATTTVLDSFTEIPVPTTDIFSNSDTFGKRYFRAVFKHERAKLPAVVEISASYPIEPPRFLFQSRTNDSPASTSEKISLYDNQLKGMEVEVNTFYEDLVSDECINWLLSHQMKKIQICFDVINSAEGKNTSVFGRCRRGKNRQLPIATDELTQAQRHR